MYRYLKQCLLWPRMKVNIAKYLTFIGVCQQVMVEHKRPAIFFEVSRDSRVEMGAYHYEFCGWFTSHSSG
jgi:hypothetical protein